MVDKVMFSSERDDWCTPQWLFDWLNRIYEFTYDAAANSDNTKCEKFLTNALCEPWPEHEWYFMNPPYGRGITGRFVQAAYTNALERDAYVVCLLPARTGMRWFSKYCMNSYEVTFITGRLKFEGAPSCAPFDSMLVDFRPPSFYKDLVDTEVKVSTVDRDAIRREMGDL